MKDRIKKYMEYKDISAGELANLLEVQRSNISHILNGRNMPGAAFIEKFLICFPDLNARWLLTGDGGMISNEETSELKEKTIRNETSIPVNKLRQNDVTDETAEKKINKIVLLFSDGTFVDYDKNNKNKMIDDL